MSIYLIGFGTSHLYPEPTGKMIAELGGFNFRKSLNKRREKYNSYKDILIRYGMVSYSGYDRRFVRVFNRATAIANNINKLKSLIILRNGKVRTVPFAVNFNNIQSFPALRRKINHSRGRDIRIISSSNHHIEGDFYTSLVQNYREYRCHMMFGECVRLSMKSKKAKEDYDEGEKFNLLIRSFHRGWKINDHYKHKPKIETNIIKLCKRALGVMRLDFGAVDVIVEEDTYTPYILELNSAPHLNKLGRQIYTKEFLEQAGLPTENLDMGRIRKWESYSQIPIKYRSIYKKGERRTNTEGL